MSLRVVFRNPEGTPEDITSRFFLNTLDARTNAEEGTVALSEWLADDEGATFDIRGHRVVGIRETRVNDEFNQYIYVGYTGERVIQRGPVTIDDIEYGTADSRVWKVQLADLNTVIDRRVLLGSDADRPAELDYTRILWAINTNEASLIDDDSLVSRANGVMMSASDYRGRRLTDVFGDCAEQSGKNYFLTPLGQYKSATDPWGLYSLFYDFSSSSVFNSTISLSNVEADINGTTVFSYESAVLTRSPERVYSGAYVQGDGVNVYEQDLGTRTEFALGGRDAIVSAPHVRSTSAATARALRYLSDMDTEEDIIKVVFLLPAEQVNDFRAGHNIAFRGIHLPGYESSVTMRSLNKSTQQVSNDLYRITTELSRSEAESAAVSQDLEATLTIGSSTYVGEPSDRTFHSSDDLSIAPFALVTGRQYRVVYTGVSSLDVGSGLTYAGGSCNGQGRRYDIVDAPAATIRVAGTMTLVTQANGYNWTPDDVTDTATLDYSGIGFVMGGTPGTDYACGLPVYGPGSAVGGDWATYDGPNVSVDVALSGSGISGFYGFLTTARVRLESRDP